MADNNKRSQRRTVFDVAKPGKGGLPTSATTRPVIVTNRPVIKDPMVTEPTATPASPPVPAPSSKRVIITPLHDDVALEAITLATSESTSESTPAAPSAREAVEQEPEATAKPPEGFPEPAPDAAVKPEDAPGVPADSEERDAESELARKRAARLQKMIDDEEYFLPIKTVEERRSRKVAIFGVLLIILLAAAWYDVALDAGLLPNTYNLPHTSFFTVK